MPPANELTDCRIRRVKCDERKPACHRCTSTGRVCDGYAVAPASTVPNYTVLSLPPGASVESLWELRAFSHFRNHSAPILSSFFDSHFWMQLVLQMSAVDPAVRHAVIAFDTFAERMSLSSPPSAAHQAAQRRMEDWRNDRFAIVQYNKAIEYMTQRSDIASSIDVVMVVCVLFVCIEAIRSKIETATMHFTSGMKTALAQISTTPGGLDTESLKRMQHYILPSLCRIELLSALFENNLPWPYPLDLSEAVPNEFTSVSAARDSMIHVMNIIMRFKSSAGERRYQRLITNHDYARQVELNQALEDWSTKLNTMTAKTSMSREDLLAAKMLRMHHLIAYMQLWRATKIEESESDNLLSHFKEAIGLGEALAVVKLQPQHSRQVSSIFLLDMELVSPVYFVAVKCRHPQVRRQAIRLLRALHRREGYFDSDLAAAVAERLMSIEEANLHAFDGSEWPREKDRVHHTDIKEVFEADGPTFRSTFFMKSNGLDAPWSAVHKEINLVRTGSVGGI